MVHEYLFNRHSFLIFLEFSALLMLQHRSQDPDVIIMELHLALFILLIIYYYFYFI